MIIILMNFVTANTRNFKLDYFSSYLNEDVEKEHHLMFKFKGCDFFYMKTLKENLI